jgi:hypothetical protein
MHVVKKIPKNKVVLMHKNKKQKRFVAIGVISNIYAASSAGWAIWVLLGVIFYWELQNFFKKEQKCSDRIKVKWIKSKVIF